MSKKNYNLINNQTKRAYTLLYELLMTYWRISLCGWRVYKKRNFNTNIFGLSHRARSLVESWRNAQYTHTVGWVFFFFCYRSLQYFYATLRPVDKTKTKKTYQIEKKNHLFRIIIKPFHLHGELCVYVNVLFMRNDSCRSDPIGLRVQRNNYEAIGIAPWLQSCKLRPENPIILSVIFEMCRT